MAFMIMGGSFNPVHIGHLIMAEECASEFCVDKVILVPARQNPLKTMVSNPGDNHRLNMLRLAVDDNPLFLVSEIELKREGPSYTVDTIRELIEKYQPDEKPFLLLGDDLARGFYSWREPDRILEMARLIIARRNGDAIPEELPCRKAVNTIIPVSSSLVRERIAQNGAWTQIVPQGVWRYIEQYGLYSQPEPWPEKRI